MPDILARKAIEATERDDALHAQECYRGERCGLPSHTNVKKMWRAEHLYDVLAVDAVEIYKPHPNVYGLACDRLGVEARSISFASSNAWDAYAASAFGMRVVWCNRYGQRRELLPGAPDREIRSLVELPTLLAL